MSTMSAASDRAVERFRPTSGRVSGSLALILAGVVALVGVVEHDRGFPTWVVAAAVLFAVLAWASMLRPALWVEDETLVMRNMLETVRVPLAAIEELALRQVLAVRVGERRLVSTVVGRTWRKTAGVGRASMPSAKATPDQVHYPDFVEERLRRLVDDARAAAGVRPGSPEQLALADGLRREPAWLPIGIAALALLALVVTVVV